LAIRLLDVVVHNNRKLFGEAAVRIDALVLHANAKGTQASDFYSPVTFRFDRVADGDRLPIGEGGLLVFMGKPRYFLDLFLTVSRDLNRSDSLERLLREASSTDSTPLADSLLALVAGAPSPDLLGSALHAALSFGDFALQVLRLATGATIGLYRNSWLRGVDGWGVGRHPPAGLLRTKDLSFGFEVVEV